MAQSESRQPSNIVWVILAGILGVFALGGQKSSTENISSTTHNRSKEERTDGGQPIANGEGPLDPLDDFFARDSGRRYPFRERDWESECYERDYLIVTVPDPIDSQFGYAFDELMDSIQRALEMGGYTIDRAWLPWELDRRKPFRTRIVTDWRELAALVFPFRGGKDGEENAGHHEDNPGTLLFRSNEHDRLRIVFLVGENPTAGIDKRALTRAINLIRSFPPTRKSTKIRIVGPYFTGSQSSMRMILHDPSYQRFTFDVLSGGATGVNRHDFCTRDGRVTFQATVFPTDLVLRATLYYLANRNNSRSDDNLSDLDNCKIESPEDSVALLKESNTAFGQSVVRSPSKPSFLELPFPLHMAQLRYRYEETRRRQEEKLNLPAFDSLVPRLSNKAPDRDSIPLQDPATTTSANGAVLQNILSILHRRRIRYVGIIASDPRDQIMLASAVRGYCPAVQIFLLGADRLLTLPEYNYALKGTIIGSTYPLSPGNQDRTDPDKQSSRLFFPDEWAQGYYNAILAQTGGDKHMIEYRPPLLREVEAGEQILYRPPVWISMIGPNGDLVPLQFFTAPGSKEELDYVWPLQPPPTQQAAKMRLSFPSTAIFPLVVAGALCLLVVCLALFSPSPRMFWSSGQSSKGWRFGEDCLWRTICLISLNFLLVPLIELCWLASTGIPSWESWEGLGKNFALALPVIILFLLALALLSPILRKVSSESPTREGLLRWASWLLYVLVVVLPVFVAIVYFWYRDYVGDSLDSWKALYFDRALNLTTGVSPLLPLTLLCATFFFWSFFQLKKSHLADHFSVDCPYVRKPPPVDSPFKGISDMDGDLRSELNSLWDFIKEKPVVFVVVFVTVAVVAGIGVYRLSSLNVPTAEGDSWDKLFFWGFVAGFFLIVLNLMRYLLLWKRLKKLLHGISLVPMMHAFDRLPHKVAVVFGGYFSTRRPRLSQLHLPHHQLGLLLPETECLLKCSNDPDVKKHETTLKSIQNDLSGFNEKDFEKREGIDTNDEIINDLSGRFHNVMLSLLEILRDFWPKHSLEEAFGSDAIEEKSDEPAPGSESDAAGLGSFEHWAQLAEGFIAMQVVVYISQFFIQLRNLAWSMIVCATLLLLGATSYPFQPERLILFLLLTLIGSVIAGILLVLVRINQDELVSRITRTTPNKFTLDWGFVSSFFTYIVPMGTVVALQMFGAFRFILEPLVRMMH